MFLFNFLSIRPPFESLQEKTLDWFVKAHVQAEKTKGMNEEDLALFQSSLKEKLWHVGCKPNAIAKRGHVLEDFLHYNWEAMEIYRLTEFPEGMPISTRLQHFEKVTDSIFEAYYPETAIPPNDLIHVSCTGYVSPSGAQKIVSKRNWGSRTVVTHAYHMGCYGAFPALRMARGFKRADIVHTEICSLHSNPSLHKIDQLVSQSLFADGFMKYSVTHSPNPKESGFKILAINEEIIPHSIDSMSWNVSDSAFLMTLSKELPVLIARALEGYLSRLFEKANLTSGPLLKEAIFAIHPGGPKILSNIQKLLDLRDNQMIYSVKILQNFGNMSSATIPHIWQAILEDSIVPSGQKIVSLAFGPGLTIAGSIMEKICGP